MRKLRKTAKINYQSGAAMLVSVVFFLFIMIAITSGLVSPSVSELRNANNSMQSKQSMLLSETGLEDAYYRLKSGKPIGVSVVLELNNATAETTITDSGYNEKTITALGDVSSKQRKNKLVLGVGDGASFNYGVQAGAGGFILGGNAVVDGNVYSNGTIIGSNGAAITGSAFSAGAGGLIDNVDVGDITTGKGDIRAHTVRDSTVVGNLYCQVGSNNGGKLCDASAADPEVIAMPITQEMIDAWKADADVGEPYTGNFLVYDSSTSLGPKKIVGNLTVDNNADLTINGTIWVTGDVVINNNSNVRLSPSYGTSEGLMVVDGTVTIGNNAIFNGSGSDDSYLMVLSTSTSAFAITLSNNAGAVILYAANGTVNLTNNAGAKALNGKTINLSNNVTITYSSGLANSYFMSGPSGGWNIQFWREVP